jgi:hypothetical protein
MTGQRGDTETDADFLISQAERLTQERLFLTKDVEIAPGVRAQRIQEINHELRLIEVRLARIGIGG